MVFVPVNLARRRDKSPFLPHAHVGPYHLGETAVLRCVSQAGVPPANLSWWVVRNGGEGDILLDDSCYFPHRASRPSMVVNDLVVRDLQRSHLGQTLACKANNNPKTQPAVASVTIDMTCKLKDNFTHVFVFELEIVENTEK